MRTLITLENQVRKLFSSVFITYPKATQVRISCDTLQFYLCFPIISNSLFRLTY